MTAAKEIAELRFSVSAVEAAVEAYPAEIHKPGL